MNLRPKPFVYIATAGNKGQKARCRLRKIIIILSQNNWYYKKVEARVKEKIDLTPVTYLSQQRYDTINCQRYGYNINNKLPGVA